MPIIERPDLIKKRRYAPAGLKLILLVAVVMGFWLRTCWYSKQEEYYEISNIEFENQTMSSVDVLFDVTNNTGNSKEITVLIRIYTDTEFEMASRITSIEVEPRSKKRYRKMIEKWSRPLYMDERLSHATVEIFVPTIF